jgi:competence protein ComEC
MPKPSAFFAKIFNFERDDLWLWVPVLFGFGAAFYLSFEKNFLANFLLFVVLFFVSAAFYFFNRHSYRSLVFIACAVFLLGGFYTNFYQKIFLSHTKITGKVYVDVVGKVESVKKFYNPQNGVEGLNLVILEPAMYQAKFADKKSFKKTKKKKAKKKKTKKAKSIQSNQASNECEATILQENSAPCPVKIVENFADAAKPEIAPEQLANNLEPVAQEEVIKPKKLRKPRLKKTTEKKAKPTKKKVKKKAKKKKKISEKTIQKKFINLANYQEIDRKFLDFSKNYQNVKWLQTNDRQRFPNAPQKISLNLIKNFENIAVNDSIAIRAMLQPPKAKEFPDDFDFALDANFKKIGAFGFALGEAKILKKADISSVDEWFLNLREKIRGKITQTVSGDSAAIILAFLIGDQSQISSDLMAKIRNSGLAHLLSISGFHLALASSICFVAMRFLLSRSQYLALRFDLKKIAAIAAIFGTYFYLKIAASPIPAQRAFLMVLLVLLALLVGEKANWRRASMTAVLALILFNPYAVFNVSFQLSFAAILVLGVFYESQKSDQKQNFLRRFLGYFLDIILLSILLQIATAPFLMHNFQNLTLLGFVANILAIPLASFLVMPLGFLALFLMPIGLEKFALLAMERGIFLLEKIITFVANLDYSNLASPTLSSLGVAIAVIGLLLICLAKSNLRFVGVVVFAVSFATILFDKKPNILFDGSQKFFAIYDENGLVFSKDLKPTKKRQIWMKKMVETEFKFLNYCDKTKCLFEKNKKFLVLTGRNKISEICKNDFDVIVNLTAKYQLPDCVAGEKIKIDNFDFYQKGGHFFYFEGDDLIIKTTSGL